MWFIREIRSPKSSVFGSSGTSSIFTSRNWGLRMYLSLTSDSVGKSSDLVFIFLLSGLEFLLTSFLSVFTFLTVGPALHKTFGLEIIVLNWEGGERGSFRLTDSSRECFETREEEFQLKSQQKPSRSPHTDISWIVSFFPSSLHRMYLALLLALEEGLLAPWGALAEPFGGFRPVVVSRVCDEWVDVGTDFQNPASIFSPDLAPGAYLPNCFFVHFVWKQSEIIHRATLGFAFHGLFQQYATPPASPNMNYFIYSMKKSF